MSKVKVYVDFIEGWQECEIIKKMDFRAVVKTKNGTVLNRFLRVVSNESELVPDGCIYAVKKPTC